MLLLMLYARSSFSLKLKRGNGIGLDTQCNIPRIELYLVHNNDPIPKSGLNLF